jgi:hypothetical protein
VRTAPEVEEDLVPQELGHLDLIPYRRGLDFGWNEGAFLNVFGADATADLPRNAASASVFSSGAWALNQRRRSHRVPVT